MTRPLSPIRAFLDGAVAVLKAPLIVIAVAALTMLIAAPFAAVLGARVQASLASQPPVSLDETEIDPEWWQEFRAQARGLDATFTPAIVGFAAPLDAISAVLDGRRPPPAVLGMLALSIVAWAFIWGGALRRYHAGQAIGVRAFVAGGLRSMPVFVLIALAAAAVIVVLYLTLHALLFGPVYQLLTANASSERTAFLIRVALYIVFFAPVALVGLVADYARAAAIVTPTLSLSASLRAATAFIGRHPGAVVVLYLLAATLFSVVTAGYGGLEIYGGSQVGGWRAIALGQVYILVRLAIRLGGAASAVRLFAARSTP